MVSGVLAQLWHHQPDRRGEVIGWFRYVFRTLSEAPLEANIIDSDFIGLAICDAMDIQAKELIPEIEELYRQGYVGQGICGTLGDVRKELFGPLQSHRKKELMNIYDRYNNILATWAGYQETQETQKTRDHKANTGIARNTQDRQERSLSLRKREEIQEVLSVKIPQGDRIPDIYYPFIH